MFTLHKSEKRKGYFIFLFPYLPLFKKQSKQQNILNVTSPMLNGTCFHVSCTVNTFQYRVIWQRNKDSYLTRNNCRQLSILDVLRQCTIGNDRGDSLLSPENWVNYVFHYGGIIISLYTKYIPISYTYCNSYSVLIERASIDINLFTRFFIRV